MVAGVGVAAAYNARADRARIIKKLLTIVTSRFILKLFRERFHVLRAVNVNVEGAHTYPAPMSVLFSIGGRLMKKIQAMALIGCAVLCTAGRVDAATVTVDPSATWSGFMNVFQTPQNGGGYVFGNTWGTADLTATFSGPVLTLGPNKIGDPDPFWYTPAGGPGSVGNKSMDANMYVETTGVYTGQTLTFTGNVLSNTLVGSVNQLGNGWTSVAFIKDFAPDFSSSNSTTIPLVPGVFSISLVTVNNPAPYPIWF